MLSFAGRAVTPAFLTFAALWAQPAVAQDRSDDNAVTQAEDAFGFSIGRETIGIYNANSARGFSPTAAGNARLDGLYFDPLTPPISAISDSSSIKVGLSAQGYPFVAPSGIVDYGLLKPQNRNAASIVINADSYGSAGIEVDGSLKLGPTLSLGYGINPGRIEYPDGTHNRFAHGEGLTLDWRPAPGIEITPFWSQYHDSDDQAGEFYQPAGKTLPPIPPEHLYDGPRWTLVNYTNSNHGVLASVTPGRNC